MRNYTDFVPPTMRFELGENCIYDHVDGKKLKGTLTPIDRICVGDIVSITNGASCYGYGKVTYIRPRVETEPFCAWSNDRVWYYDYVIEAIEHHDPYSGNNRMPTSYNDSRKDGSRLLKLN